MDKPDLSLHSLPMLASAAKPFALHNKTKLKTNRKEDTYHGTS